MDEQRSPEWYAARLGKVTASEVYSVYARTKGRTTKKDGHIPGDYTAARANYMRTLVTERLTGESHEVYESYRMRRGREMEPEARAAFTFHTGLTVTDAPFIPHPTIAMAGASPDGFVGDRALVEFKAPDAGTQVDMWEADAVPDEYLGQCHWQLACCPDRDEVWFVSYDPRLPDGLSLFVKRIERDDGRIAEMEAEVRKFLKELDEMEARLRGKEAA